MKNRVWVYMSDKELSDAQCNEISNAATEFLSGWNAHGVQLSASFELLEKRFIIIKADEREFTASGCSIDKQVKFVKEIEQHYGLNFFNRLLVAIKKENGLEVIPSSKVGELLKSGVLNENSLVYNAAVATDDELASNFLIPLKNSWLNRYLTAKV